MDLNFWGIIFCSLIIFFQYLFGFFKNLKPKYFCDKKYIIPFISGMLLLTIFFLVFTIELVQNVEYLTVKLFGFFPWGTTLYTYGLKKLLILEIDNNECGSERKKFDVIFLGRCLKFLYIFDVAAVILYILIII